MGRPSKPFGEREAIANEYYSGVGYNTLSKKWNTTPKTIRKILDEFGIRPRGNQKEDHSKWNGGIIRRYKGARKERFIYLEEGDPFYSMTTKGQSYVREHRLILARHLGRPLLPTETVHHINGDTLDNRIENLQLRTTKNHGLGQVRECGDCGSKNIICRPLED